MRRRLANVMYDIADGIVGWIDEHKVLSFVAASCMFFVLFLIFGPKCKSIKDGILLLIASCISAWIIIGLVLLLIAGAFNMLGYTFKEPKQALLRLLMVVSGLAGLALILWIVYKIVIFIL